MSVERGREELTLADVRALSTDWLAWTLAALLMVATSVLAVLLDEPLATIKYLAVAVPVVVVLALALTMTVRRAAPIATGALVLAVTPAALSAVAAAEPAGAFAALVACAVVIVARWGPVDRRAAAFAAVGLGIAALAGWAAATSDQPGPTPTWGTAMTRTGAMLWGSVGTLDPTTLVPTSGWLAWWLAAGLLAGAALVAGDLRAAMAIPLAAAAMVVAGWLLIRWRGAVDISGGAWILVGAVAYTGGSVRLERGAARRVGRSLLAITAFIWVVATIHLVRV